MSRSVSEEYAQRVKDGSLRHEPAQVAAAAHYDALMQRVQKWRPPDRGIFGFLTGRSSGTPKGLYIHGPVGRGKTLLMDIFYELTTFRPKRRIHFHEFMSETHDRIGDARKRSAGDPMPLVTDAIAAESRLLCFDELHVTDIADAMILGRLFEGLFERGVVVVATSNAEPHQLYHNGLNRNLFVPFIKMLTERMDVISLAGPHDFRLEKLAGQRLYFTPADAVARAEMDKLWNRLTGDAKGEVAELVVKGRRVAVPQAANGVARFSFDDLCAQPLGANDYLSIARAYHTVMIDGIPSLGAAQRNEARRFINLIDTLYDARVSLIASADADATAIYKAGDGVHLFERTASRLIEMRSEEYLNARAERLNSESQNVAEDLLQPEPQ